MICIWFENVWKNTLFWLWNRFFFLNFLSNISNRFSIMKWDFFEKIEHDRSNWRKSKFRKKNCRLWCCRKSNDLTFSRNMRNKSSIIKWNFEIDFRNIDENVANEIKKSLIDAIFTNFDMILCVAIEKFESFDETKRETIFVENIWFRDVAKKIDDFCKINETNERMFADFSMILHVNFDVKTRKFKFLTDFRIWYSRICSWNLLLKSKIWLHRRHIVDFFVDFVVFSISFTKLIALIKKWKFSTNWLIVFSIFVCFWVFCSRWYARRANCYFNL